VDAAEQDDVRCRVMRRLVVLFTVMLILLIVAYSCDGTRYRNCRALGGGVIRCLSLAAGPR
jgi:hypothetical protein